MKPLDSGELVRAVHRAVMQHSLSAFNRNRDQWLREEVRRHTERIREVTTGTLASLLNALEARSSHFRGHSQSVSDCAAAVAGQLGLPDDEVDAVRVAGLLHDIGMIGVPDSIVGKPRALTAEERRAVEAHCEKGAEILQPLAHLSRSARYVLEHHERLDGSGYPSRKRGAEISTGGLIVGVAETWRGLREERPFRDRISRGDALATLAGAADEWYPVNLLTALSSVV
jgi:putative nucleotidyltransferase with HDIG domain